jgi:hypothetical protein
VLKPSSERTREQNSIQYVPPSNCTQNSACPAPTSLISLNAFRKLFRLPSSRPRRFPFLLSSRLSC